MLNNGYHLFWSIFVLLMLGFGMLIGASFYGPSQVKAQGKMIAHLRDQANTAVQQGQAAQDQLAKTEGALDALRPALVRGKLAGKRVTVLLTGDYPDAAQSAHDALTDAGATVAATVTLTGHWPPPAAGTDVAGSLLPLAALLVQGTADSVQNQQTRDTLQDQGLIGLQGDLSKPTSLFVLVGGRSDPGADAGAALDTALAQRIGDATGGNARVVGCEPLDAAVSTIKAYQDAGLATVDCVDQPLGRLDLPFALRGGTDSYGLKPTADRTLPASLDGSAPQ